MAEQQQQQQWQQQQHGTGGGGGGGIAGSSSSNMPSANTSTTTTTTTNVNINNNNSATTAGGSLDAAFAALAREKLSTLGAFFAEKLKIPPSEYVDWMLRTLSQGEKSQIISKLTSSDLGEDVAVRSGVAKILADKLKEVGAAGPSLHA